MIMGLAKKEMEAKEEDDRKSGIFCSKCGNEIPKSDLKDNSKTQLCSDCNSDYEKITEEK